MGCEPCPNLAHNPAVDSLPEITSTEKKQLSQTGPYVSEVGQDSPFNFLELFDVVYRPIFF